MLGLSPISVKRVTDSITSELVTLAEAKEHLRVIDFTDEDVLITAIIKAARQACEEFTNRALSQNQTWTAGYECIPSHRRFSIPRPPLASVTVVRYYDDDNILQTIDPVNYIVDDSGSHEAVLSFLRDYSLPTYSLDILAPIRITFTAGYAVLPENLKQAMLFWIQLLYDQRSPVAIGVSVEEIPMTLKYLLNQFRVHNNF